MTYQNKKQAQAPGQDEKQRPEERYVPEGVSFGLPNSVMMAMPAVPPPGTPNSVMREILNGQAGKAGSGIRGIGFDPSANSRELLHITRKNAVSVPAGRTIQREGETGSAPVVTGNGNSAEGEDKQQEEAERKRQEEAERKQREEAERKQKEEAERKQKEEERRQQEEAERKQKEKEKTGSPEDLSSSIPPADPAVHSEIVPKNDPPEKPKNTPEIDPADHSKTGPKNDPPEEKESGKVPKAGATTGPMVKGSPRPDQIVDDDDDDALDEAEELYVPGQLNRPVPPPGPNPFANLRLSDQEARDTFNITADGKAKYRRRLKRHTDLDIEKMTREYKYLHPFYFRVDDQGNEADQEDVSGAIDYALGEAKKEFVALRGDAAPEATLEDDPEAEEIVSAPTSERNVTDMAAAQTGNPNMADMAAAQTGNPNMADKTAAPKVTSGTKDGKDESLLREFDESLARRNSSDRGQPDTVQRALGDEESEADDVMGDRGAAPAPLVNKHWERLRRSAFWMGAARNVGNFFNAGHQTGVLEKIRRATHDPKPQLPDNFYARWLNTIGGGAIDTLGAGAAVANTILSGKKFLKDRSNIKLGASRADAFISFNDTISNIGSALSSGFGLARHFNGIGKSVTKQVGLSTAKHAASAMPWLSAITGGINTVTGAVQAFRGGFAKRKIKKQLSKLNDSNLTDLAQQEAAVVDPHPDRHTMTDQQKLREIFEQGKTVSSIKRNAGIGKALAGALASAGGIVTLAGVGAPVGLGLGAASSLVSVFNSAIETFRKHNLRSNVVAEELGIDWEREYKAVKAMVDAYNPHMHMRSRYKREVILRAHHAQGKTRTEAFRAINLKRARYLLAHVKNHTAYAEVAEAVIEGLGVHKVGPKGHQGFADDAYKLLAEKLGG